MIKRRIVRRRTHQSPDRTEQFSPTSKPRLPSLSSKFYRPPLFMKDQVFQQLELESIFKRLDISPNATHGRSPLRRRKEWDIQDEELRVPCTTRIPGEQEAAEFVTALITRQASIYKKTSPSGLTLIEYKADQLLLEMSQAVPGHEPPVFIPSVESRTLSSESKQFWRDHISPSPKIRWADFEESLLLFLSRSMVVSLGNIRKVDWSRFFQLLKGVISCEEEGKTEWPELPKVKATPPTLAVISEADWTSFVCNGSLNHTILMAMDTRPHYFSELNSLADSSQKYVFASGDSYQGHWLLGKRHGQGLLTFRSGETYVGQFVQGKREGYGVMRSQDSSYKGDWKADQRHGYGFLTIRDTSFRGYFHSNRLKSGLCQWSDGSSYEGEWDGRAFSGSGKYVETTGLTITGSWKDGKLHGTGEKKRTDGTVLKGEWIAGVLEGEGEIKTQEFIYKGSIVNGLEHGLGDKVWTTGFRYHGEWENGQIQGLGELTLPSTDVLEGIFNLGSLLKGTIRFADGRRYDGDLQNYEMHGSGVLIYPKSSVFSEYRGSFLSNTFSGHGEMDYSDGSEYKGGWLDGAYHGLGTLRTKENVYRGQFLEGKFQGQGQLTFPDGSSYKGNFEAGKLNGVGEIRNATGTVKKGFSNWEKS